ncbi:hypothetical protein AAFC00_007324 [Neodothiora populina]|uniref:UAA transporter n=1 Tax=Neodothiora populina TaxID=2781224 RepID=A0ABR3PHX7_9PEZI
MADVTTAALSTVGLIFGGCCSNVFALEAIIKKEADSGLLITFFQFLLTTAFAYPSQSTAPGETGLLKPRTVPLSRWATIAAIFFAVNMMNNWAFAFDISVPVHIILRSFGSVTTMIAGAIKGKKYSPLQVSSVMLLTVGVLISAWADAVGKGKDLSAKTPASTSSFAAGLSLLLAAQIISAWMGIFIQDTYAQYGASWKENMFYSHFLSIPLFLPLAPTLHRQYSRLAATPPLSQVLFHKADLSASNPLLTFAEHLPVGAALLFINAMTQLACISGVNLLSANASAVTVTIVLNIRKLVSFVLSTIIFGHSLSGMMTLGSVVVFGSGALYGFETSWRIPQQRKREEAESKGKGKAANGKVKGN